MQNSEHDRDAQLALLKQLLSQRDRAYREGNPFDLPYPKQLRKLIHDMAEARFEPARALFQQLLMERYPDEAVTLALVNALGFHWIDQASDIAPILIRLFEEHTSDDIRLSCANALGSLGEGQAIQPLARAICNREDDEDVRQAAASSLLEIARVPHERYVQATRLLEDHCAETRTIDDAAALHEWIMRHLGSGPDT